MRRFIIVSLSAVVTLGLAVGVASAQFGRFQRPVQKPTPTTMQPMFAFPGSFGPFMGQSGALVHAARGTISANGTFVPSGTGPFVLSTRGRFEPLNGTFTPSPTGNFTLKTREIFNPNTGNFVPSQFGNIVVRERGDFVPSSGTFAHTTTGSLNFSTGAFVPGGNGTSTLSTRGLFVPANGTFVPSQFGQFVLTTKESFNPATGTFTPSKDGTFSFMTRGNFIPGSTKGNPFFNTTTGIPFNPFLASGSTGAISPFNPMNPLSPLNSLNNPFVTPTISGSQLTDPFLNVSPLSYAFLARNPYLTSPYGYYGYSNPYVAAPYAGGYPSYGAYASTPSGAYGNYGNYGAAPSYAAQPQVAGAGAQAKQPSYAIPTDELPLAFRLMSPTKKQELLDPLETQLQNLKTQADNDKVSARTVRDAKDSVDNLRAWLRSRRTDLAEGTYDEANNFLRRLDRALSNMKY
jgi:hypothetical protein